MKHIKFSDSGRQALADHTQIDYSPGDIIEVEDSDAESIVAAGHADIVDAPSDEDSEGEEKTDAPDDDPGSGSESNSSQPWLRS